MTAKTELYGIAKTNCDGSIMSKNVFPTFFPVAAALYLNSKGKSIHYIRMKGGSLELDRVKFADALRLDGERLNEVVWHRTSRPNRFKRSYNGPPVDLVPELDGKHGLEMDVELTVVPTFARKKVTEVVVRQNTQFTFAERLAYCQRDLVDAATVNRDTLQRAIRRADDAQAPFMLHGVWQTLGKTSILNEEKTADVYMISDFAYLHMLMNVPQEKGDRPTRAGKGVQSILTWLTNFFKTDKMVYKDSKEQSASHLKVNLYPSDHLDVLKTKYHDMRLDINDVKAIVPQESISKISPERRLDASLAHMQERETEKTVTRRNRRHP